MHFLLPSASLVKYSFDSSLRGKKPCLSLPKLINAASKLVSTLETVALNILPFRSDCALNSLSKSNSLAPSTNATRSSSEYEQLIKILFIFFSNTEKVNSTSALRVIRVLSLGALLTYSIYIIWSF